MAMDTTSSIKNKVIKEMNIYPIPTFDKLFVDGADFNNSDFRIYDINGHLVHNGTILESCIQTNTLHQGIYFIKVSNQDGVWQSKFIKTD